MTHELTLGPGSVTVYLDLAQGRQRAVTWLVLLIVLVSSF